MITGSVRKAAISGRVCTQTVIMAVGAALVKILLVGNTGVIGSAVQGQGPVDLFVRRVRAGQTRHQAREVQSRSAALDKGGRWSIWRCQVSASVKPRGKGSVGSMPIW